MGLGGGRVIFFQFWFYLVTLYCCVTAANTRKVAAFTNSALHSLSSENKTICQLIFLGLSKKYVRKTKWSCRLAKALDRAIMAEKIA